MEHVSSFQMTRTDGITLFSAPFWETTAEISVTDVSSLQLQLALVLQCPLVARIDLEGPFVEITGYRITL